MWDNVFLLRNIANTLITVSVCAVIYGAGDYAAHLPGLFPLREVRLVAPPQQVAPAEIARVLDGVHGNFFTVDIDGVKQALEQLPWVSSVSVYREFPNRLVVQLAERRVLARWNNSALVDQQGEVFAAKSDLALPDFDGPEGTSAMVTRFYRDIDRQLAGLDLQVKQVVLSQRGAWQLHLNNGMVLELGREDVQQRLSRFVAVFPYSLAAEQGTVKFVDLRYRNGFAVSGSAKRG